ncbi:Crp/Fnr family transcriptional regulator [Ureibacillus massiliensis]|uniref:Crp/Fnr family transcriptional regulator n=1 Tax=Ureibacillus massiliensis TaxID=292806 RepID=UPI0009FC3CB6|nr:Crp/Fnr family transcriptional regulator [Ureibacillus massiliensis]
MVVLDNSPLNFHRLFENNGQFFKVDKGNHIFQEGEMAHDIFLIKEGKVQISKEQESGKELTIRICGKGSILGETTLFSQIGSHSTSAIALSQTEIFSLSKSDLELLLTEQPALLIEYLKWLQNENIKNQSLIRDLVMNGKKGALYSTLIRLSNTYGEITDDNKIFINFNLTNTELANLCSTSREMVNRMLNDLRKQNVLSIDKGYITIHDLNYLKTEICCDNCPIEICRID